MNIRFIPFFTAIVLLLASVPCMAADGGRLSTHVMDFGKGGPVGDIEVTLFRYEPAAGEWKLIAVRKTDADGRIDDFLSARDQGGMYKYRLETLEYYKNERPPFIFPWIEVVFVLEGSAHYHIPIILTETGYSAYRGE